MDRRIMRLAAQIFRGGTQVTHGLDFPPDFLDLCKPGRTMPELSRPHLLEKIRE
jgi:hypothetical protein